MLKLAICTLLIAPTSAFAMTGGVAHARHAGAPTVSMSLSRRSALSYAGVAAASLLPLAAAAETTEEAMERIAAKSAAKNAAAKEAERAKLLKSTTKSSERENEGSDILVKGAAVGSFVLSLPFFYKNLARLGLRWSSAFRKVDPALYDKDR